MSSVWPPRTRTVVAVAVGLQAGAAGQDAGAEIAYPPTWQGQRGTFAIVIQGDVQHGLWQR